MDHPPFSAAPSSPSLAGRGRVPSPLRGRAERRPRGAGIAGGGATQARRQQRGMGQGRGYQRLMAELMVDDDE